MPKPTYKLSYFAGRGRAEISRIMFAEAGAEYEDDRVTDWPGTLKASTCFFFTLDTLRSRLSNHLSNRCWKEGRKNVV